MMIGGDFKMVDGEPRAGLIQGEQRPAAESLTIPEMGTIRWLRGGSAPETTDISFALFDVATGRWKPLGVGSPISGGWQYGPAFACLWHGPGDRACRGRLA